MPDSSQRLTGGSSIHREPIQRQALGDQVAQELRLMIRMGELRPGSRLIETDLAEMLGVSRGPIRDALQHLARERLVTISPSRGAIVTAWSDNDLAALFDMRTLLEVEAIVRATSHAAAICSAELTDHLVEWKHAVNALNRVSCAEHDFDFHRVIWRHAQNPWLSEILEHLVQPCHTIFYLNTSENRDLLHNWTTHERVRDFIAKGEPNAAGTLMKSHMAISLAQAVEFNERISGSTG